MTVIFVTYHNFYSNSSIQVFSLANWMVELGHQVHVCIPNEKETVTLPGDPHFICHTYEEALKDPGVFLTGDKDIVIQAWTPRECVRKFVKSLEEKIPASIFVHLEDNEEYVAASLLHKDMDELLAMPDHRLDTLITDGLSHPKRYRQFLASANGVSMLIDRLSEFVPSDKPQLMFWPAHNDKIFHAKPRLTEQRRQLGLQDAEIVLSYVGNLTPANRNEVLSLYLAVFILRRMGYPVRLVRTGQDYTQLFSSDPPELDEAVISLGRLDHHSMIPEILGMADILVQPGQANDYNDYRFPSKLPEFFSIGRPVLLPYSNLGRFVRDGIDAIVLKQGNAVEIAEKIIELIKEPALYERLSQGALEFSKAHFSWKQAAEKLLGFYQEHLSGHSLQHVKI